MDRQYNKNRQKFGRANKEESKHLFKNYVLKTVILVNETREVIKITYI